MEPFIRPDIYQRYPGAVDEFTLSTLMAADAANGGLAQLETHYDTFIVSVYMWQLSRTLTKGFDLDRTGYRGDGRSVFCLPVSFQEQISRLLGAGLNWIRVPLAFWAIETWEGEPYLEGTSWKSAFYPASLCELQLILNPSQL